MGSTLPPFPECGEPRVLFRSSSSVVDVSAFNTASLYACVCLGCGHTTLRPNTYGMEQLRKAAEKGKAIEF